MKPIVCFFSLLISSTSFANCYFDFTKIPTIPNGSTATFQEMLVAQQLIEDYVRQGENSLQCNRRENMKPVVTHHIHKVADSYNREVQKYNVKLASL